MSTETIFRQLGRLNESHTGIGPGRTREEYLKLFSRASYSTQNEWPYPSPFAGFYDVSNTATGLILLNQRHKFSHLRGQVLPKESSHPSEDSYQTLYESILASEEEQPKSNHTHKILSPRIPVDPYRHFESILSLDFGQNKYWHNRMCKGSFSTDDTEDYSPIETHMTLRSGRPHTAGSSNRKRTRSLSARRRAQSAFGTHEELKEDCRTDPAFAESLQQYYHYQLNKSHRPKLGLQQYRIKEPSNRLLRQSGIYRNPALTPGQKLFLLEKCHIYDTDDSKTRHTNAYLQVLTKRFTADLPAYKLDSRYKPEFRLNDPRDYFSYAKFVKTPRPTARPLNTGYFTSKPPHHPRLPNDHRKQPSHHRSTSSRAKKDSVLSSNISSKENPSRLSRRTSTSSIPTKNENTVTFRLRQEPKNIHKIPVLPLPLDD